MNSDLLPHSIEAEQGLIGSLFVDNAKFFDVHGSVTADDFFMPAHGDIFEAIREKVEDGKNASPITLKAKFEHHPDLGDVGGSGYLAELASGCMGTFNVENYAETIAELSERRRLMIAMEKAHADLLDGLNPSEVKANLSHDIEGTTKSIFVKTKREVALDAVKALELPKQAYSTGLAALDNSMAGGLIAGFTYGFCAPEKAGKTTFAHTISENLNSQGVDHAYLALEMGSAQIEQRNIARALGVNSMAFLSKTKSSELIRRAAEYTQSVQDHTIYLDMPGSTFAQIKAELSSLVAKKKIKGFILDYWQLVGGCPARQTKADFWYDVAQWTANFARRHGIWCILLSQVNRDGKVFGSAGLEKACDQLYFIEKCEAYGDETSMRWLNLTHSRYTPTGSIGSDENPKFEIDKISGPYIREVA